MENQASCSFTIRGVESLRRDVTYPYHTESKASWGWNLHVLIPPVQGLPPYLWVRHVLQGPVDRASRGAGNQSSGNIPKARLSSTCQEVKQTDPD